MSPALSGREPSSWQLASSARSPAFAGLRSPSSPSLAKMRFSPTSGTASAIVAIATIFRNDGSSRSRPLSTSSACAILNATPAPHSDLQGYSQPCWFGIHHGESLGHALRLRQMMIGDDEIDAATRRSFRGGEGANPGVHADDEPDAAIGRLLDHLVAHAVAFANAVRHVILDFAAT